MFKNLSQLIKIPTIITHGFDGNVVISGQTITALDFTIAVEAGEDIDVSTVPQNCYVDSSDGKAYKCDADDLSKIGSAGFALNTVTAGQTVYIKTDGIVNGFSSLTPNAYYYISTSAGAITATKPTNFKIVAKAITATAVRIYTDPTVRVRVYESSDTWAKPAGLICIEIEVQAAGGGSGGVGDNDDGSGAGAGGYGKKRIYASDLAATETVTVGIGGTAGAANPTTDGGDGGDSSFGTHVVCDGGLGSVKDGGGQGAGGNATGGDINIPGQTGGYGASNGGTSGGPDAGFGGSSKLGIGGQYPGGAGTGYGAGAAGPKTASSTDVAGTIGKAGVVVVTEFY